MVGRERPPLRPPSEAPARSIRPRPPPDLLPSRPCPQLLDSPVTRVIAKKGTEAGSRCLTEIGHVVLGRLASMRSYVRAGQVPATGLHGRQSPGAVTASSAARIPTRRLGDLG